MAKNTYIPSVLRPDCKKRIHKPARACRTNPRSFVNAAYFGGPDGSGGGTEVLGMAAWKAKGAAVQTEGLENVNPLSR
jgi:hypothetical protein